MALPICWSRKVFGQSENRSRRDNSWERSRNRFSINFLPVDIPEKRMSFNLISVELKPDPLLRVLFKQLQNQIHALITNPLREPDRARHNIIKQFFSINTIKRGARKNHFIHQDSKQVPVHTLTVSDLQQHLRSHVSDTSTERVSQVVLIDPLLR